MKAFLWSSLFLATLLTLTKPETKNFKKFFQGYEEENNNNFARPLHQINVQNKGENSILQSPALTKLEKESDLDHKHQGNYKIGLY